LPWLPDDVTKSKFLRKTYVALRAVTFEQKKIF